MARRGSNATPCRSAPPRPWSLAPYPTATGARRTPETFPGGWISSAVPDTCRRGLPHAVRQAKKFLAAVFGVRVSDRQRGREGSRLIHPKSPFAQGECRDGVVGMGRQRQFGSGTRGREARRLWSRTHCECERREGRAEGRSQLQGREGRMPIERRAASRDCPNSAPGSTAFPIHAPLAGLLIATFLFFVYTAFAVPIKLSFWQVRPPGHWGSGLQCSGNHDVAPRSPSCPLLDALLHAAYPRTRMRRLHSKLSHAMDVWG
jgi:hypothetical protein